MSFSSRIEESPSQSKSNSFFILVNSNLSKNEFHMTAIKNQHQLKASGQSRVVCEHIQKLKVLFGMVMSGVIYRN